VIAFEGEGRLTTITGNYDDFVSYALRTAKVTAHENTPVKKEREPMEKEPGKSPNRLTYKEKEEFAGIEAAIEAAEGLVARIEESVLAPQFYQQDYAAVQQTLKSLEDARSEVNRLYARWHELEQRLSIR
jgi:ATP-binding cassette subfamily F protein uup